MEGFILKSGRGGKREGSGRPKGEPTKVVRIPERIRDVQVFVTEIEGLRDRWRDELSRYPVDSRWLKKCRALLDELDGICNKNLK
jgi:hypothetical protein